MHHTHLSNLPSIQMFSLIVCLFFILTIQAVP